MKDALAAAGSGGASAKEAAQNVRDRFPRDYFAHRAYQGASFSGGVFSSAVQTEYRALRDRHPEDPLYITLYAPVLVGSNTKEAIALLGSALTYAPLSLCPHETGRDLPGA